MVDDASDDGNENCENSDGSDAASFNSEHDSASSSDGDGSEDDAEDDADVVPPVPPSPPPPSDPPASQAAAKVVTVYPACGGKIVCYVGDRPFFEATCPRHKVCVLTRTAKAKDPADTPDIAAAGMPLGFMACFLQIALEPACENKALRFMKIDDVDQAERYVARISMHDELGDEWSESENVKENREMAKMWSPKEFHRNVFEPTCNATYSLHVVSLTFIGTCSDQLESQTKLEAYQTTPSFLLTHAEPFGILV